MTVTRTSGRAGKVVVRVRRGKRVLRTVRRRGVEVTTSPTVKRGTYRIDVIVGKRVLRIPAKQR